MDAVFIKKYQHSRITILFIHLNATKTVIDSKLINTYAKKIITVVLNLFNSKFKE